MTVSCDECDGLALLVQQREYSDDPPLYECIICGETFEIEEPPEEGSR